MRQFFEEDLGQYHFYGLDHIQPLRFGGTNSNNNLRFTMEGPHSAVDTLTPNKTNTFKATKPPLRAKKKKKK